MGMEAQRDPRICAVARATCKCVGRPFRCCASEGAEPADKPGSVVDSHSSRRSVTATLEQPTRKRRGPRHRFPIWPCSRWGLPCRPVARLAVRSYRTISPLPASRPPCGGPGPLAVSFCCTFRRLAPPRRYLAPCPVEPGLSSAPLRVTRLSGRLRRRHSTASRSNAPKVRCANFGPGSRGQPPIRALTQGAESTASFIARHTRLCAARRTTPPRVSPRSRAASGR